MVFFDKLETRTAEQRAEDNLHFLRAQIVRAKLLSGYSETLSNVDVKAFSSLDDLKQLSVMRKSDLTKAQKMNKVLGGLNARAMSDFAHIFQSPGPIYEPGGIEHDWWRMGRFLHAAGIGQGDIIHNCFGYHLTPAGMIFENGAHAVGVK